MSDLDVPEYFLGEAEDFEDAEDMEDISDETEEEVRDKVKHYIG